MNLCNKINIINNNQNIFCIYVNIPCGSIYENSKNSGISHILEHILLVRTKQFNKQFLNNELTKIGSISNASTSTDITSFYIYTTMENWKIAIDILSSVIRHPEIHPNELEIEKKIIVEEVNMRADMFYNYYNLASSSILDKKNVYINMVEGTSKTILSTKKKDLLEYYNEHYNNYIVLANCSKNMTKKVYEHLEYKFGKNKTINLYDYKLLLPLKSDIFILYEDTKQFTHIITFPSYPKYDYYKCIIFHFIRFAFINGSFNSVLLDILRTKLGLIYSINSSNSNYRYLGIMNMEISTSSHELLKILQIIIKCVKRLKLSGISNLEFFKASFLNSKKLIFKNERFRSSWYSENLFYGVSVSDEEYVRLIEKISNEDIMLVAREIFDFSKCGIVSYGNYSNKMIPKFKKDLAKILTIS